MTSFAKETYEQDWNFESFSGIYKFTAALLPTDTLLQREGTRKQTQDSTGKEIGFMKVMVGNISSTTDPSSEYNLSIRRGRRRIRRSVSVQKVSFSNFLLWKSYFS